MCTKYATRLTMITLLLLSSIAVVLPRVFLACVLTKLRRRTSLITKGAKVMLCSWPEKYMQTNAGKSYIETAIESCAYKKELFSKLNP